MHLDMNDYFVTQLVRGLVYGSNHTISISQCQFSLLIGPNDVVRFEVFIKTNVISDGLTNG